MRSSIRIESSSRVARTTEQKSCLAARSSIAAALSECESVLALSLGVLGDGRRSQFRSSVAPLASALLLLSQGFASVVLNGLACRRPKPLHFDS